MYSASSSPFEAFEWTPLDLAAFNAYGGDFANVRKPVTPIYFYEDLTPPPAPPGPDDEQAFLAFAFILGICMGPMQAASRTMIGRLAPAGMTGEFYGLFALSGRATTFLAPFRIGVFTQIFASQRAALVVVPVFLAVGFVLLWFVKAERPRR